jgi:hypothetical protein
MRLQHIESLNAYSPYLLQPPRNFLGDPGIRGFAITEASAPFKRKMALVRSNALKTKGKR